MGWSHVRKISIADEYVQSVTYEVSSQGDHRVTTSNKSDSEGLRDSETTATKRSAFNMGICAPNARKSWVAAEKAIFIEVAALVNSPTDKPPDTSFGEWPWRWNTSRTRSGMGCTTHTETAREDEACGPEKLSSIFMQATDPLRR